MLKTQICVTCPQCVKGIAELKTAEMRPWEGWSLFERKNRVRLKPGVHVGEQVLVYASHVSKNS